MNAEKQTVMGGLPEEFRVQRIAKAYLAGKRESANVTVGLGCLLLLLCLVALACLLGSFAGRWVLATATGLAAWGVGKLLLKSCKEIENSLEELRWAIRDMGYDPEEVLEEFNSARGRG